MAMDFPASPTDGQVYPPAPNSEYIYSTAKGAWLSLPTEGAKTVTSDTAPVNPKDGDQWFSTIDGVLYIYVVDVDGGQWVESRSAIISDGYYSPNYIINGDFSINQRSFSSTTSGGYGFDRWRTDSSGGTVTYSAQTFSLGAAPVSGYEAKNYARVVTSGHSAVGNYTLFRQPIESVRTLANSNVTVSFWAKAASGSPKVALEWQQVFGTGGSPSSFVGTYAGQVTLSTSWTRYSLTFLSPNISGKTLGSNNDDQVSLNFFTSAGSDFNSRTGSLGLQNNTIDFWGVQVEEGSVATPFRRNANSIQGELAACQRYYFRNSPTTPNGIHGNGYSKSVSTEALGVVNFPVEMRIAPTSVEWSNIAFQTSNGTLNPVNLAQDQTSKICMNISFTPTSGSWATNLPGRIINNNSTTAYIGFSAEL